MKTKKIFLVTLLLLAVLTIGAVSASEDVDTLAADNDEGEDLSLNESSSEVISTGDNPAVEDITIDVNAWDEFPLDDSDNDDNNHPIQIRDVPKNVDGTVVVSNGDYEIFSKELKDFNESEDVFHDGITDTYGIHYKQLNKLNYCDSGCIIKVTFLKEDGTPVISSFHTLEKDGGKFKLPNAIEVGCFDDGRPLYTDSADNVVSLNVRSQEITGIFYVEANGTTYRYEPKFDENGEAWHNWVLSSFDITTVDVYNVTVRYAADENSPREVILRGKLNVTEYKHDVSRVITDDSIQSLLIYTPDNENNFCISVFARNHNDEWYDEWWKDQESYPERVHYVGSDQNIEFSYTGDHLQSLNLEKENNYEIAVIITFENGYSDMFFYNIWCSEPWDGHVPSEVEVEIAENSFNDENENDWILNVLIPEKSQVYNGTIEIKSGESTIFTKEIFLRDMDFDEGRRCYQYPLSFSEVKDALHDVDMLSFVFNYDTEQGSAQASQSFVTVNPDDNGINIGKAYYFNVWDEGWNRGILYVDCNESVIDISVNSPAMDGVFYVTVNGTTYRYNPNFDENGEAYHNWVLSSFNITEPGVYPVTLKYSADSEAPIDEADLISESQLFVNRFNDDLLRVVVDKFNHLVRLYCPDGVAGTTVLLSVKHDWEEEYSQPLTYVILDEDCGKWINWTFDELNFINDEYGENILNVTVDERLLYENGIFYHDYEEWELFKPTEVTLIIDAADFHEGDEENRVVDLYIPETTFINGGTINITSGDTTVFSTRGIGLNDMEFSDDNRYYSYHILYGDLENIGDLSNWDVLSVIFMYDNGSSRENVTRSFFYNHWVSDDGDDEADKFNYVKYNPVNLWNDEVAIVIASLPTGADDEFNVTVNRWGEEQAFTLKISELTESEDGMYYLKSSVFHLADIDLDIYDTDFEFTIQFYNGGLLTSESFGSVFAYRNPYLSIGEISRKYGESNVIFIYNEYIEGWEDTITVNVTENGALKQSFTFKLSEMEPSEDYDRHFCIDLGMLNLTENGVYNITMEFTKDGIKTTFNSTISVVDFVIDKWSDPEYINDPIFGILLPEDSKGKVVLLLEGRKVFEDDLSNIDLIFRGPHGFFAIPLNDLQINESGIYNVTLQVYDANGNLLRAVNNIVNVTVGENRFEFRNLMYGYGEANFLGAEFTKPVPIGSEFVLYLNDKRAGSAKLSCDEFGFRYLDKSFIDVFNQLKPKHYEARIELLVDGNLNHTFYGSFDVFDKNGTAKVTIPTTSLITNDVYLSFFPPKQKVDDYGRFVLMISIDPCLNEEGEFEDTYLIDFRGEELEDLLKGTVHKINLGRLSAGNHIIFVKFMYDNWDRAIDHEFFSGLFTINVQKVATKITASAVTATYNIAKKLVITLKDGNKLLAGKKVTVKVGSINKVFTTNKKGQILVDVSILKPSTYTATIKYAGDSIYKPFTLTVKKIVVKKAKPKFTTKKVKVKAKSKIKKIKITLKHNKKGVKGKKITLKIKGKTYKAKTNKKGVAIFKVKKLGKGKFTGILKFKGDKYFKAVTGKVKVIVK